jgi:formylglycine-generating enzyme required for sulfatase activity
MCVVGFCCLAFKVVSSFAADPAQDARLTPLLKLFMDELVDVTPGEGKFPKSFRMGSESGGPTEQPVHEVTFTYSFAIARYEVPQNLYEAVMGINPSKWKGQRNAAEMMTFADAVQFCGKLTDLLQQHQLIGKDDVIRLPTEAEWEYCCRAGTKTAYSFGDEARKLEDTDKNAASLLNAYGWHTGNAAGNDPPVGALKPNPWGLYDMHGYLWEFTLDDWSPNYEEAPTDGSARRVERDDAQPAHVVLRGGSWKNRYPELRSSARISFPRDRGDDAVGIRCVKSRGKKSS